MARTPKQWVHSPAYQGLVVAQRLQAEATARANELVETGLKSYNIEPTPTEPKAKLSRRHNDPQAAGSKSSGD